MIDDPPAVFMSLACSPSCKGPTKQHDLAMTITRSLLQTSAVELVHSHAPPPLPSGMVLSLVDAELSRRLVRDVIREHMCSLLASQWGRGGKDAAAAQISHEEAPGPTLEEIVAALAAAPVLPPPRVVSQWHPQEQGEGAAALSAAAHDPYLEPDSYVQLGGQPTNLGQWQFAEGGSERPEVLGVAASTVHRDTGQPLKGSANGAEAVWLEEPAIGLVGDVVDLNVALSGAEGGVDEPAVGGDVAPPVAGMNSYFAPGGATDTRQLWQSVYSNRRVQQQQLSRSSQTTAVTQQLPDTAAAAATTSTAASISAAAPAPTTAAAVSVHIFGQALPQQLQSGGSSPPISAALSAVALRDAMVSEPSVTSLTQTAQRPAAVSSAGPLPEGTLAWIPQKRASAPTSSASAAATFGAGGRQLPLPDMQTTLLRQQQGSSAIVGCVAGLPAPNPDPDIDTDGARLQPLTRSQGVQSRGVQAHGAEARGVQAHGVVEERAVQAHGAETRGTQAVGVQERGLQAAGVMDSASQADAPPPHYLLQAALAAGACSAVCADE